jgi:hypothetical protein
MSSITQTQSSVPLSPSELDFMTEHFYGYGRWDAPFWFIGPEPGGTKDGDCLEKRYDSWKQLGFKPVIDCAAHHYGFEVTKWHQTHPPTQTTWRQLIRLLLSYKGMPTDIETIRAYQRDNWGSSVGETCVIELSGLASPNMRTPLDRTTFLSRRIECIRQEVRSNSPEFILMYGKRQRVEWENIAGGDFDIQGFRRLDSSLAVVAPHPVSHGTGNEFWEGLGRRLRAVVLNSRIRPEGGS